MLKLQEPYNQLSENDEKALAQLCWMVNKDKMTVCEIGCWLGHSTSIFGKYVKPLNGKVICVDNFRGSVGTDLTEYADKNDVYGEFRANILEIGLDDVVETFYMNSGDAYNFIKDESIDLLFIDGDHRYEQVKEDINNYLPKVKQGGIIAGHDFEVGFDLDLNSLTEIDLGKDMSRGFHCGVIKAVKEKFSTVNLLGDRVWYVTK